MVTITALLYFAGSLVCHQIPERSFHLSGVQLPVCARCTGLYLGAALGLGVVMLAGLKPRLPAPLMRRPPADLSFARARMLLLVSAVPTAITVATAWLGLWDPGNAVRAALALPLGFAVGAVVAAVATRRLR